MAFKLNLGNPYTRATPQTTASHILGARQQLRWTEHFGYFESPRMHMMSAACMFLLGLTLATLRPAHLLPGSGYDMTPTGSIATAPHAAKPKSCD